ncbi:hypothetical protein D3C85_1818190 [compost metagenome]
MTNIELKQLALNVAILNGSADLMSGVVDELARTERNFILGKDQTTIDIERDRLANGFHIEALNTIKDVFRSKA